MTPLMELGATLLESEYKTVYVASQGFVQVVHVIPLEFTSCFNINE